MFMQIFLKKEKKVVSTIAAFTVQGSLLCYKALGVARVFFLGVARDHGRVLAVGDLQR